MRAYEARDREEAAIVCVCQMKWDLEARPQAKIFLRPLLFIHNRQINSASFVFDIINGFVVSSASTLHNEIFSAHSPRFPMNRRGRN